MKLRKIHSAWIEEKKKHVKILMIETATIIKLFPLLFRYFHVSYIIRSMSLGKNLKKNARKVKVRWTSNDGRQFESLLNWKCFSRCVWTNFLCVYFYDLCFSCFVWMISEFHSEFMYYSVCIEKMLCLGHMLMPYEYKSEQQMIASLFC